MNESRRAFLQTTLAATGLTAGLNALGGTTRPERFPGAAKAPAAGKISLFSKHLHWLPYEEMGEVSGQLGFDGLDLTVRPGGHVEPERVAEDLPRAVAAVRKAGGDVFMITTAITGSRQPHTETILKTAAGLGIPFYRMGWLTYDPKKSVQQQLKAFTHEWKALQKMNRRYRIHGDYQVHAGAGFGAAVLDLWTVLRELDGEWIGCQYDIRHAVVEGAHSWPIGLNLLKDHIKTINFKDVHWAKKGDAWGEENVPLGQGMVPFAKYLGLLQEYNIRVPVSLHCEYPLGGAEEGKRTLTLPREQVLGAIGKDLATLKGWLHG